MAKKQAQFRFEEDFLQDLRGLAEKEGMTISEIVRNSIKLYSFLYNRTKGKEVKIFLEDESNGERCEVGIPWLS
jgi:hypothetical protein